MKLYHLYIILFVFFPIFLLAQEPSVLSKDRLMEEIAESLADDSDENTDLSTILDELEELINRPLNINTASLEELEKLRILNTAQIESLLNYRKRAGQFYSIYELSLIEGFNENLAAKLSLFITVDQAEIKTADFLKNEINIRTQYVFEKTAGFIADENGEKSFAGIEPKLYINYKGQKGNGLKWGLTAENDAGESFFGGNNKTGFDFYSGHLAWNGKKLVKQLIVGDFQAKTGQGLLFWSGYGGRKTIDGLGLRYVGQGIRPYSSSAEYGFFRGIATELSSGKFSFTAFYSKRNADANVTIYDAKGDPAAVSSIIESGYHRTENEISDKKSLPIQTAGSSLRYTHNHFSAAVNSGIQHYKYPLEPEPKPYNQFYFRGKTNFCASIDFQQALKMATLFGELAVSRSGGTALLIGADASPSSEIALNVIYRDYKKDFHSIGGNPFSEFGTASNERGIYSGVTLYAIPRITITAFLDLYESHWVKYTSLRPIRGNDFAMQAHWSLSKQICMNLRYKTETRNENSSTVSFTKTDTNETVNRLRYTIEWEPSEKLHLRFRADWNGIVKEDSLNKGIMLMTDATTRFISDKLTATARIAWYKTHDYSSGIRAYENDMPQNFSFPVYYLNGLRYYLNLNFKPAKAINIYLKISQSILSKEFTSFGSGYAQIDGNHKTEIKLQVRYKF